MGGAKWSKGHRSSAYPYKVRTCCSPSLCQNAHNDTRGVKAGQIQNLDLRQHQPDTLIEPANRYLFWPEVLELTRRFGAFTPRYHCQAWSSPEPSTISVVLLFRMEVDVIWNLAIKYAPEFLMSDDIATLLLHIVWLR